MKKIFFKLCLTLLLMAMGVGQASAQSVYFTHNRYRGAQKNSESTWRTYSSLDLTTSSDWIQYGNGSVLNGYLNGNYQTAIQRYNKGWWSGDLFDWFTLTYTAPSYSNVTYTLYTRVEAEHSYGYSSVRAAYFDYGTDYSRWSSWVKDPKDWGDFRTSCGTFDDVTTSSTSTRQGETIAAWVYRGNSFTASSSKNSSTSTSVTVNNSTGSSTATMYRYGGFSSSKSNSASSLNYNHYCRLYMACSYSITYYKYVTFNANGGTGTMNKQSIGKTGSLTANAFTREGFTFAGWNTKADGTGTTYTNQQSISVDANTRGALTLYAQWTANPIEVVFDYSCLTGISEQDGSVEDVYTNLDANSQMAENPFTNKVRVSLRDAQNNILGTSVILTAPAATNAAATITSDIATHKKATMNITVANSGSNVTSGSNCVIVLSPENYLKYSSIDFEVLNANGTAVAPLWVSSKSGTKYVFTFTGFDSENMFKLTWRVNLKGLNMYPATIFAKPMRQDETPGYIEISPLAGTDGVICAMGGYIKDAEQKIIGAYYDGQYNVRKTCTHNVEYGYKLGLTGFHLDGINYYLDDVQGGVPEDMISEEELQYVSATADHHIDYDRSNLQIPVLLLSPNGTNATVNGKENYMLYVDNHATRTVNLAQFEAVRPGYNFLGWIDAHDETPYAADANYTFNIGTKATTTLAAQWKRITAPALVGEDVTETDENFTYKVKVWDELNDVQSVKYIYTDTDEKPAANADGWANMVHDAANDSIYSLTILRFNNYNGKYLWAKAANEDKDSILAMGKIRSIYTVWANANPDSHVTERIENGTWTEPTDEGGEPVFNGNGTYTERHYYDYYSTFYFSKRAFIATNAMVYIADRNGSNGLDMTTFIPSDEHGNVVIPANTAVILRKNQGVDGKIELHEYDGNATGDIVVEGANILKGVDNPTAPDEANYTYYVLSYAQNGLGFYVNVTGRDLAAHKAYFTLEGAYTAAAPRAFIFNFGNGNDPIATAIENTEAETLLNGPVYNIYGQMVAPSLEKADNLANGIYIVGGQKIFINK